MKKFPYLSMALFALLWLAACSKPGDNFRFGPGYVGPLHGHTAPDKLQALFPDDSIGRPEKVTGIETQTTVRIFEKGTGKPLLQLNYRSQDDTLALWAVEILSPRYHSEQGPGLQSSFAEWKKAYKPGRVETTLQHVVVFFPQLNATLSFGIDALADAAQHNPAVKPDVDAVKPGARAEALTVFLQK